MAIATTAEKNSLATKYSVDMVYGAIFTADPGTTGTVTGEVTGGSPAYARKTITWGSASGGVITGTCTFDVPTSTTVTYAGVCSSSSGANLLDRVAVTSQAFASQGQYAMTFTYTQS